MATSTAPRWRRSCAPSSIRCRAERVVQTPKLDFPGPKPGVYFVDKPDVNQSTVFIVGLGTRQDNPDYYALSVMNDIFSGGFGSRVFQNVRTKLGLAYEVGGEFSADYDHPGIFYGVAATKSASTVPATQAVLQEIGRLKTSPPTAAEMHAPRTSCSIRSSSTTTPRKRRLSEQVTLAFYGYPPDFLERYKDGIEHVTAADVTRVANNTSTYRSLRSSSWATARRSSRRSPLSARSQT